MCIYLTIKWVIKISHSGTGETTQWLRCLLHNNHENLSSNPSTHITIWTQFHHTCHPSAVRSRHRRIAGTYCLPVSVKKVSSGFRERPCLKEKNQRVVNKDTHVVLWPLHAHPQMYASAHIPVNTLYTYIHTHNTKSMCSLAPFLYEYMRETDTDGKKKGKKEEKA